MLEDQNLGTRNDFTPTCYNNLFRYPPPENYVEIYTSKSFSKSHQKKLKLINDSKSLQKKRKIRPLKVRVDKNQPEQAPKQELCSIKQFKAKINRITQQSNIKTPIKLSTQHTDITESIQIARNIANQSTQSIKFQSIASKEMITSFPLNDPFPTLATSLVVNEGAFNPQSLLQTQNSVPSNYGSHFPSPTHQQFESLKRLANYRTPKKQKAQIQEKQLSTKNQTEKKQRIELISARRVETHQTFKTQNEACHSVVEENQYKKIIDNLTFPDYFSPEFRNHQHPQKSSKSTYFNSYLCQ